MSEAMTWKDGLPTDGADGNWLGQSADGRQWLLAWSAYDLWCASGFITAERPRHSEIRVLNTREARSFIVRHMSLPATITEEANPNAFLQEYPTPQDTQ